MFFNIKKKPILNIKYYDNTEYDIEINNKLTDKDISNISSFIFLLTYQSPISVDIINKLKSMKNTNNTHQVDSILTTWATYYLEDKNKPMIEPLSVFKHNVIK